LLNRDSWILAFFAIEICDCPLLKIATRSAVGECFDIAVTQEYLRHRDWSTSFCDPYRTRDRLPDFARILAETLIACP
jgi:hypothetical protein